jgi:type IV secretory pathway TrbD component
MAGFTAKALGLSVWLLILLSVPQVNADPFFVKVYGRTYKVDPRYRPNASRGHGSPARRHR